MLKISNLSKSYAKGNKKAVDSLNLEIKNGEIFGFIGPNGAGKTTTIKMITGILNPDRGEIEINGHSLKDDPIAAKMSMGYVPDNHDIYEMLTGREYLSFMADMYNVPMRERKERIERYLSQFELDKAVDSQIKSYSHGMKQKLVITGALLHEPALWILDEPLVGLDPRSAMLLKEQMRAHCSAGNTVFFSTHVLEVAERLCDRIGIIDHGRLIAVGTLDELRSNSGETLESIFLERTAKADA
ncbi:MAG: 3-dehydroquinate dehydratase [Selenomonadales bacterium]|jgi:ABC transporter related protein|nr:ABC transporter ATP-binding protein [Clostridiales bacterium]PWM01162.1 MAG: 3-dehydroquinate dehydratase [Selenomonadales bacterium]